ncbi:uncharacterized protein LOC120634114 [Pararge aegeria]|uniref:uncharacterized protein LOC120634114 n=1 Tax=Pararge aegeria TaxID=116150 RepID=UPI0019CF8DF1|nr:uncharacterized protein LOC120634114 [Pararge aegeria]
MALYGAPVWSDTLTALARALLRKPQRVMAVRVIRGYRTISCEAACVLAGTPPWDLDAEMLSSAHWRRVDARLRGEHPAPVSDRAWRSTAEAHLVAHWRERLLAPTASHRTIEAIQPVLELWTGRKHGSLSFHLVQILSVAEERVAGDVLTNATCHPNEEPRATD